LHWQLSQDEEDENLASASDLLEAEEQQEVEAEEQQEVEAEEQQEVEAEEGEGGVGRERLVLVALSVTGNY
jgi:hypothetical protein